MRQKMIDSPLCDAQAFAEKLEEAYLKMWETFVSNQKENL
jgi:predicted O-linked N-acetylglucosamine transferase (SPINDLY family)